MLLSPAPVSIVPYSVLLDTSEFAVRIMVLEMYCGYGNAEFIGMVELYNTEYKLTNPVLNSSSCEKLPSLTFCML